MKRPSIGTAEWRAVSYGIVAAALLAVEFIAGMQTYVLSTVIPIVGSELHAHQFYGVITGSAQAAMFLTMPLGPYLLHRFRVERILLHLTWLSITGGVISAIAPTVGVFVLGRALAGLAAGALSTVSLSTIVTVLPASWRRATLAGFNVMWVSTSLIGPAYAGWVTSALSWRWALVLYLPVLVVARMVLARRLRGAMQSSDEGERLRLGPAITLSAGVALLSLAGLNVLSTWMASAVGGAGLAVTFFAAHRLLPAGSLRARPGRPAAVATMGLLTGAYFGAAGIVAIAVHDILSGTTVEVSYVLAGGGLAWASVGLAVSRWPAETAGRYISRSTLGACFLALGLIAMACALLVSGMTPFIVVLVGWILASIGMGLVYLDTLNRIVDAPSSVDGVSVPQAATSAILVEAIATAVMATLATALVGRAIAAGEGASVTATVLTVAAVLAVGVSGTARRVLRSSQFSSAATLSSRSS